MNKIVKDALILFAITLVAGVLLGFVYDITKDPIAAQNEKAKQEAYKEVMADADSFEALSGGVFQNRLLLRMVEEGLEKEHFTVLRHHLIPANDGGIALGQAAYAMQYIQEGK